MNVHEQFAEDLALHAMGTLQGEELVPLQAHLQSCADCRRELELLRGDVSLLAMSTAGSAPPRHARQRFLQAVAREPRHSVTPIPARRGFWPFAPWFAAVASAVLRPTFDLLCPSAADTTYSIESRPAGIALLAPIGLATSAENSMS